MKEKSKKPVSPKKPTESLHEEVERLDPKDELVLHSDQGWHYQMQKYQMTLSNRNVTQSMSCKGNCLDNAVIENFFCILKTELLYLQEFESLEHSRQELDDYMIYYNQKRMKKKLKNMSPVEYRTHVQQAAKFFCLTSLGQFISASAFLSFIS